MLTNLWDSAIVLMNSSIWFTILYKLIMILLILIAMKVIKRMGYAIINRMIIQREGSRISVDPRRLKTLQKLLNNILNYTVTFIGVLLILSQFGIELMPILAGAGVIGLAVAFGAQNLVRDMITGLFIIFEDQFAVGDYVRIQSYEGTVQEIGIRITKLKSSTGETHIIPNGSITQVTNFSINNSAAIVDLSVSYKEDLTKLTSLIERRMAEIYERKSISDLINKPEVQGVQTIGSNVALRIKAECKPNTQSKVKRELQKVIIELCKQEEIAIT